MSGKCGLRYAMFCLHKFLHYLAHLNLLVCLWHKLNVVLVCIRCLRLAKERKRLNQSTRIVSSAKCSSVEILSSLFLGTPNKLVSPSLWWSSWLFFLALFSCIIANEIWFRTRSNKFVDLFFSYVHVVVTYGMVWLWNSLTFTCD